MPDSEAFTRIIAEHHSSLRHYIGGFGVNPAWVDDIAQDTFLVVYRKWEEFLAVDNPGAWLRTIAKNLVLNETAKLHRRERLFNHNLTKLLVEAEDLQTSTATPPMPPETLDALRSCLAHLTKKARGVVEARYFKNMNSFQIGQEMAMKPAAVRKLLFHARQSLAGCLREKTIEIHW